MVQKNSLIRGVLAGLVAHALAFGGAARADEYDDLRARWVARIPAPDLADADVAAQVAASQALAQTRWDTMIHAEGRTALWPDLADFSNPTTFSTSFARLNVLAGAYFNGNANLRNNPAVLAAVQAGIDWLVANHYHANAVEYGNWWEWQINAPQQLNSLMVTLYSVQTQAQRDALIAVIDRFVPDPTTRLTADGSGIVTTEAAANLLDKCFVVAMRGMLGKNHAKLVQARDAISPALPYMTSGNGFYADGSYIDHLHTPYLGGYGGVLLTNISRLYYLLRGSQWDITDPNKDNAFAWAMNSFRPFIYDGAMMDNQRGRGITREAATDHVVGRGVVGNMLGLAQSLPDAQGAQVKSMIKGWMQRDTTFAPAYYTGMSASDIQSLKAILNDPAIPGMAEPVETRVYASADRAVQRRPGHAFAISMFSKRMSSLESGNGENLNGWWFGIGSTWLYNADQTQFSGTYWATTDMWRLPGITTDHSGSGTPVAWKHYGNTKTGTGGAELDQQFAAVGMDFGTSSVTGSKLVGKKAWFLFGDKVVAVGSGIATTDGRSVETIVENRKLTEEGNNALTVNGEEKDPFIPWQESMPAVRWAHLAGNVPGADIGYIFPDAPTVAGLRERRSGRWRDVAANGSTDERADNYLSLALDHGVNPAAAAYTYMVVPNKTAAEVAAIAANPGITVLERSTSATAVKDTVQGVTGVLFWNDASKTVNAGGQPLVTSDRKAAVVLKQNGTDFKVSVADPTQLYTGNLNLDINRAATAVVSTDPGVTVLQTSPTIKLAVAVNGSLGKSYGARFVLSNLSSLYSAADAYVRDGASAASNFGATSTITVKNDAAGYVRQGLLKFDLSNVEGTIVGASLRLTPVSVGMAGITHKLYATANASWDEATVTWNNRPANAALLGSWVVPAAPAQVQVDVTSQAVAAQGGNKLLSFEVEAAQNYGSAGSVDYASRQHSNVSQRPVLVLTVQ